MSAYLTCAQVADELGVSARTVLRWIEAGDLPAIRLPGGRLRVSETALISRVAAWATEPDLSLTPKGDSVGVTPNEGT